MFVIGDDTQESRIPWVTLALLIINISVFCLQKTLGDSFTDGFSLVPAEITTGKDLVEPQAAQIKVDAGAVRNRNGKVERRLETKWITVDHAPGPAPIWLTLFTCMFLHGSLMHLIG